MWILPNTDLYVFISRGRVLKIPRTEYFCIFFTFDSAKDFPTEYQQKNAKLPLRQICLRSCIQKNTSKAFVPITLIYCSRNPKLDETCWISLKSGDRARELQSLISKWMSGVFDYKEYRSTPQSSSTQQWFIKISFEIFQLDLILILIVKYYFFTFFRCEIKIKEFVNEKKTKWTSIKAQDKKLVTHF